MKPLASPPAAQDPTEPAAAPTRVLVVDDYDDAREMYAEYLAYVGYQVDMARNGQEALEKAQAGRPDVILMDLSLPVMDGWEATRRLKRDARTRDIPVMALSGHALEGHSEGAYEAGANAFVPKPALPQDVEARIRTLLGGTKPRP